MEEKNLEENDQVENLKCEMMETVVKCTADSEEVWQEISTEQAICVKIMVKQIMISDKFSYFHEMWRMRNPEIETSNHVYRLNEVEEAVNQLNYVLCAFEEKVQSSHNVLQQLNTRLSEGLREMDEIRNTINNSNDIHELLQIRFPDFQRLKLKSPSYNKPWDLDAEWDHLDIDRRITSCLAEMEDILDC